MSLSPCGSSTPTAAAAASVGSSVRRAAAGRARRAGAAGLAAGRGCHAGPAGIYMVRTILPDWSGSGGLPRLISTACQRPPLAQGSHTQAIAAKIRFLAGCDAKAAHERAMSIYGSVYRRSPVAAGLPVLVLPESMRTYAPVLALGQNSTSWVLFSARMARPHVAHCQAGSLSASAGCHAVVVPRGNFQSKLQRAPATAAAAGAAAVAALQRAACASERRQPRRRGLRAVAATAAADSNIDGGPAPPRGSIDAEILLIALPTIATLAADPLASLVSTAFIGRLGASPLASAGVALSVYNSITKMLNMPLLAVTTSSVAQALGAQQGGRDTPGTLAPQAAIDGMCCPSMLSSGGHSNPNPNPCVQGARRVAGQPWRQQCRRRSCWPSSPARCRRRCWPALAAGGWRCGGQRQAGPCMLTQQPTCKCAHWRRPPRC
jgi:hypothetical protein